MRCFAIAALASLLVAAAPAADATDFCDDRNWTLVDVGGLVYMKYYFVVNEHGYLWDGGFAVATESNGEPGPQDEEWLFPCTNGGSTLLGDADICQDTATPDTCIF